MNKGSKKSFGQSGQPLKNQKEKMAKKMGNRNPKLPKGLFENTPRGRAYKKMYKKGVDIPELNQYIGRRGREMGY